MWLILFNDENKAPAIAFQYNLGESFEKYEAAVASKELINDYAESLGNFLVELNGYRRSESRLTF